VVPVLVRADAFAEGIPFRDLHLSPDHCVFLDGQLVPVRLLLNGTTIIRQDWRRSVRYWHIELAAHGLVLADGAVTESYLDDGNRHLFGAAGLAAPFVSFGSDRRGPGYDAAACAPVLRAGPRLDLLRARLAARAAALAPDSVAPRAAPAHPR
jgi:hypothetical protein